MVLFLVVQQSFGGYLIAAVAVIGAETRQLRKEHEQRVGVLQSLKLQLTSLAGTEQNLTGVQGWPTFLYLQRLKDTDQWHLQDDNGTTFFGSDLLAQSNCLSCMFTFLIVKANLF